MKYSLLFLSIVGCTIFYQSHHQSLPTTPAAVEEHQGAWLDFRYHAKKAGLQTSRWHSAAKQLRLKLKDNPGDVSLTTLLAGALYVEKNYRTAAFHARRLLRVDKNNHSARNVLALCMLAAGKSELAETQFALAFKSPQEVASGMNLGFLLLRKRDYSSAVDVFMQVLARCDSCQDAYLGQGIAQYLLKEHRDAIATFKKGLKIKHSDILVYHLALVYRYGNISLDKAYSLFIKVTRSHAAPASLRRMAQSEATNINNMQLYKYQTLDAPKDSFGEIYLLNPPQADFGKHPAAE